MEYPSCLVRYHGTQGALPSKQCVLDQMLPDFTDIVIWVRNEMCFGAN